MFPLVDRARTSPRPTDSPKVEPQPRGAGPLAEVLHAFFSARALEHDPFILFMADTSARLGKASDEDLGFLDFAAGCSTNNSSTTGDGGALLLLRGNSGE